MGNADVKAICSQKATSGQQDVIHCTQNLNTKRINGMSATVESNSFYKLRYMADVTFLEKRILHISGNRVTHTVSISVEHTDIHYTDK